MRTRTRYLVSGHPELDRTDPFADVMSEDKYPEGKKHCHVPVRQLHSLTANYHESIYQHSLAEAKRGQPHTF